MKQKSYIKISGTLFLVVGLSHLIRAFLSWQLVVGEYVIPVWVSYVAGAFLLYLSYKASNFNKKD